MIMIRLAGFLCSEVFEVKKKYHNIYSPLIDTIELAGPDILKEFEAKSKR
jgi:hypothetical protein